MRMDQFTEGGSKLLNHDKLTGAFLAGLSGNGSLG